MTIQGSLLGFYHNNLSLLSLHRGDLSLHRGDLKRGKDRSFVPSQASQSAAAMASTRTMKMMAPGSEVIVPIFLYIYFGLAGPIARLEAASCSINDAGFPGGQARLGPQQLVL
jgi:hypothetical protein